MASKTIFLFWVLNDAFLRLHKSKNSQQGKVADVTAMPTAMEPLPLGQHGTSTQGSRGHLQADPQTSEQRAFSHVLNKGASGTLRPGQKGPLQVTAVPQDRPRTSPRWPRRPPRPPRPTHRARSFFTPPVCSPVITAGIMHGLMTESVPFQCGGEMSQRPPRRGRECARPACSSLFQPCTQPPTWC